MANKIIPKRSSVSGKVPATTDLDVGEIAVNLTDRKIYTKDAGGTVVQLGGGAGSGDVVGPNSSTDNAIARFDLTTGKLIQNSSATIDDSGNLTATTVISSGTGADKMATGTTAQRPGSPTAGMFRMNSTTGGLEIYTGTAWVDYRPSYTIEYLVIGGGGGGGGGAAGGGGAGGYRCSVVREQTGGNISNEAPLIVTAGTAYSVVVGAGGTAGAAGVTGSAAQGGAGSSSSLGSITSNGGGFGGGHSQTVAAGSGGSGGGAGGGLNTNNTAGSGTSGQGYSGGVANNSSPAYGAGGGGGAGQQGGNGSSGSATGTGGSGITSSINGTATARAGGGGGGTNNNGGSSGGAGGGGSSGNPGTAGSANTGGGGGGGIYGDGLGYRAGGAGGSGVVIVRYPGAQRGSGGTVTSANGYTIHTFTSSGTFTA